MATENVAMETIDGVTVEQHQTQGESASSDATQGELLSALVGIAEAVQAQERETPSSNGSLSGDLPAPDEADTASLIEMKNRGYWSTKQRQQKIKRTGTRRSRSW